MQRSSMILAACACASALMLTSCGGSSTPKSSSSTGTTVHVAQVAQSVPSESAKMICAPEAIKDINETVGVNTVSVSTPTWNDHVYSCDYIYPGGAKMTLSVKEMSNADETTGYFNSLQQKYGQSQSLQGIGQGAFATTNGSVVARKDYKVLFVDVSQLPAQFGVPAAARGDAAINTATDIMGCWTGA